MARLSSLLAIAVALTTALLAGAFAPVFGVAARHRLPAAALAGLPRVVIDVSDSEPVESALRRFKREVSKSGHLMDLRHKRYFETPQEKKKRKVKEGRLRAKFERLQRQRMAKNRV